jgi:cell division septum initiation protein DivIVA
MKKFSSIKELQPEKKRIRQQQRELENKIRGNWSELRESVKPVNIAKDAFKSVVRNKTRENLSGINIIKGVLSIGAALLAKRIVNKAGKRLARFFRK